MQSVNQPPRVIFTYEFKMPLPPTQPGCRKRTIEDVFFEKINEQNAAKKKCLEKTSAQIQTNQIKNTNKKLTNRHDQAFSFYMLGLACEKLNHNETAFDYYARSLNAHPLPIVLYRLGHLLEAGKGTPQSTDKALNCYKKAALYGLEEAGIAAQLLELKTR